jgi:hypothetical protein
MMIDNIKLLLGNNITPIILDDLTIRAALSLASQHYLRYRPNSNPDWGASPRAYSWIMEYTIAYCKLIVAESMLQASDVEAGTELVAIAQTTFADLERELVTYP